MIKKTIIVLLVCLMTLIGGYSATFSGGLNVVLSNQNPDPVNPGNFVYVNVKLSNPGSDAIENAQISFEENQYFSLAPGADNSKNLGTIPQFSTDTSSYVIAKYKVYVSPETPIGLNSLTFDIESSQGDFSVDMDILVQDTNPSISVDSFSVNEIESGNTGKLELKLNNTNTIDLKDIIVTLNLDNVENNVISVENDSNEQRIDNLGRGESISIPFDLTVSPDAVAKPYQLPLSITFEDSLGNSYSQDSTGSLRVFSKPQLTTQIDSQTVYSQGNGRITLAFANPGTSVAKGVQVEILESDAYTIIDGKQQYIGDMNPDDFQTLQSDIYLTGEEGTLDVKLIYLDSYNNRVEETINLDLTTFDENQLQMFNLESQTAGSGVVQYVVGFVLVILSFILGRKYGYKKAKKKLQKQ